MQQVLFLLLIMLSSLSWATCYPITGQQLSVFFEGVEKWTEVQSEDSFELATKRPVFLDIGFKNTLDTKIQYGDEVIQGKELSLCWLDKKRKKLRIRKGFFQVILRKVKPGLLRSWIPFDGDLYYRKDKEVIWPHQRGLADESNKVK